MKTVSIIIVNCNGRRFLKRLFETIQAQTFQNFEVIFVDNDSKDDSVAFIEKKYGSAKIVRSENLGYGSGCNIGAVNATGKYLAFLNEDMHLPENFLENMIEFRKNLSGQEKIGGISCKMVDFNSNPSLSPPTLGGTIDIFGFAVGNKNPKDVFVISGSPFFISRELFEKIGGFNEMIFIYGEDVDLSWRLKIFGYNNFINNNTYLFHYGGGATGNFGPQKIANVVYGSFISIFTNYSLVLLLLALPFYFICLVFFYILMTIAKRDLCYMHEIFKKKVFFLKNIKKAFSIRRFVQKGRIKNDLYVFRCFSIIPAFFANKSVGKIRRNYTIKNT